jgi:hypothetical protein
MKQTTGGKKVYRKPEISRVKIVPGETVLAVCKLAPSYSGPGITGGNCNIDPNPITACQDQGS